MAISFVYITAPNLREAKRLGRHLVDQRLAACINILPQMHSIYRWKDRIEEAQETILIAKTQRKLVRNLIKEVERLHPYEVPCALAFDINSGSTPYLKWLTNETKQKNSKRS